MPEIPQIWYKLCQIQQPPCNRLGTCRYWLRDSSPKSGECLHLVFWTVTDFELLFCKDWDYHFLCRKLIQGSPQVCLSLRWSLQIINWSSSRDRNSFVLPWKQLGPRVPEHLLQTSEKANRCCRPPPPIAGEWGHPSLGLEGFGVQGFNAWKHLQVGRCSSHSSMHRLFLWHRNTFPPVTSLINLLKWSFTLF